MNWDFLKSNSMKSFLFVVGILVIVGVVFTAGLFVGFHQAKFNYRVGERYYSDFFGPKPGGLDPHFINSHGASGSITAITGQELTINDNNVSKKILVSSTTVISPGPGTNLTLPNLKVGDQITVIGSPNDQGQIAAKFIRVQ